MNKLKEIQQIMLIFWDVSEVSIYVLKYALTTDSPSKYHYDARKGFAYLNKKMFFLSVCSNQIKLFEHHFSD